MYQPFQACNLKIKLLRRLEEPRGLSDPRCLFTTCMGILMVTLGILVIVYDLSDPMALSIGMTVMAMGFLFMVLAGALALCPANQNSPGAERLRLEEVEGSAGPPDWTEPSVVASTFL